MTRSQNNSLFQGQEQLQEQGQRRWQQQQRKKKPKGIPVPGRIIVELSLKELKSPGAFMCMTCQKVFQRQQNLQMHLRTHNDFKKVKDGFTHGRGKYNYICPELACIHHDENHALGDISAIKKHYWRKHCKKTHRCENCSKIYALIGDLKQHLKNCKGSQIWKETYKSHVASSEAVPAKPATPSSSSTTSNIDLNQGIDSSSVDKSQLDWESGGALLRPNHNAMLHADEGPLNQLDHEEPVPQPPCNLMEAFLDSSEFLSTIMGETNISEELRSYLKCALGVALSASATVHQEDMPLSACNPSKHSLFSSTELAMQAHRNHPGSVNDGASSSFAMDYEFIGSKVWASTDLSLSSLSPRSMARQEQNDGQNSVMDRNAAVLHYDNGPSSVLTPTLLEQERYQTQQCHLSAASRFLPQPGTMLFHRVPSPGNLAQPSLLNLSRSLMGTEGNEFHPPTANSLPNSNDNSLVNSTTSIPNAGKPGSALGTMSPELLLGGVMPLPSAPTWSTSALPKDQPMARIGFRPFASNGGAQTSTGLLHRNVMGFNNGQDKY